jgi:diguanylate cyclase (GGDEF)-like protein/PAS domain S-box-containing protein
VADRTVNPFRAGARRQNALAFVVLAIAIAVGALAFIQTRTIVEQDTAKTLLALSENLREALQLRLQGYDTLVRGLRGLYHSVPDLDSASFKRYAESLNLADHLPAVHSISFARHVPREKLGAYLYSVRDPGDSDTAEGRSLEVSPPGNRPEYLINEHVWPARASEMLGFDIIADPAQRAVVERARDTGRPTATGRLRIRGDPMGKPGYALHFPVYFGGIIPGTVDVRRQLFEGVLSITFWTGDLGREVLAETWASQMRLLIYDMGYRNEPEQPALLFDSHPLAAPAPPANPREIPGKNFGSQFHHTIELFFGGRIWLLGFVSDLRTQALLDRALPWIVFFGCLVTGLLLFVLIRSLVATRANAFELATRMTEDLNVAYRKLEEEQRRTQQLIEVMPYPVFIKDREGHYLGVNEAWENFYGIPRNTMLGKTIRDLFAEDLESRARAEHDDELLFKNPGTQISEPVLRTRDGKERDVIIQKATFTGADGSVGGLIGTIIDITKRKQSERRQGMEHAVTRVLAESATVADAIPRVIQTICETMGWLCGARWELDPQSRLLECREYWGIDAPEIREFLSGCAAYAVAPATPGTGPVRQAYGTGKPVWITDVARQTGMRRAKLVLAAGLHGAAAFPLLLGNEVLGVLEFFHRDIREPDAGLLRVAESIGSQIGQFLQRKRAERNLQFAATHDPLTRLPNRHLFAESLAQALARAERSRTKVGVLFVDLDHFKSINDTLGHEAGDQVLAEVAVRLTGCLRQSDVVSRQGGDEFVALIEGLPDTSTLTTIARKMLASLAQPFLVRGRDCQMTGSIGIAIYPEDGYDRDALLKNADAAMYQAKDDGRSTYRFFSARPERARKPRR